MRVAVTGANGYIGVHVVTALRDARCQTIAVDFANGNLPVDCEFRKVDILAKANEETLYEELGKPDAIIHLAWKDGFKHNSEAHLKFLAAHYDFLVNMHRAGCKNISVMGSMHEVGYYEGAIDDEMPPACNPMSLYGIAKNALRQAMMAYASNTDLKLKWLRAFYIVGDEERAASVFGKILQMAKECKMEVPFTTGENECDFIAVDELGRQIAAASMQTKETGIINVCSGRPQKLKDAVNDFIVRRGLKMTLKLGAYPSRAYDSPCIYGTNRRINSIMADMEVQDGV